MGGVAFVHADPSDHTVVVDVADPSVASAVVRALGEAGFETGEPTVKEGGKQ